MKKLFVFVVISLLSSNALAQEKSVNLKVPTMNCITCPITITKALERVNGVEKVKVTYVDKLAKVTFDDQKTSVQQLINATTNAGYPAQLQSK